MPPGSKPFPTLECASNANPPKRKRSLAKGDFKKLLWPVLLILLVVILDQGTKLWAVNNLSSLPTVDEAKGFLEFNLIYNQGGALGTNFGSSNYYLISGFLILAFLLFYIYYNRRYPIYSWPLSIIAGGAIGNIIDRLRLGKVIDFIDVDFFDISFLGITRWWTFNIADAAISCSIVFLIVFILFFHKRYFADATSLSNDS